MSILIYIISLIVGAELGVIITRVMRLLSFPIDGIMLWLIFLTMIFLCILSARLSQHFKFKRLAKLLSKNNSQLKFFESCNKEISQTADRVLKIRLLLILSRFYINEKNYQKSLDAITEIKPCKMHRLFYAFNNISRGDRLEYYLQSINLNLIYNNIIEAQNLFEASSALIFENKSNSKFRFDIDKTLAFLEYSKGVYDKADSYVTSAIDNCTDLFSLQELKLLKAKIYIKTDRIENSHKLLEQIINDDINYSITESARALILKSI